MAKENSTRSGCKDVFRAFLVKNACYAGDLEIPCIKIENQLPTKLISFSKALEDKDYDAWVHFYEDDAKFERLWNRPKQYLPILKKYAGVISPDFSVYRDMPLVMQQWNIYRSRAIGHWLQENGVHVIPNIRFGDERTFELSCTGITKHGVIAVGSYSCIKLLTERKYFKNGLSYVINTLHPHTIVVYGSTENEVFAQYKEAGIKILQFNRDDIKSQKAVSV